MKKIFAEIGFGNATFLSTEYEVDGGEYREKGFVWPARIRGLYFRVWIFKNVFILDFFEGFKTQKKDMNKFKFLLGFRGEK